MTINLDWNESDANLPAAGVYHAEVTNVEQRYSRAGDAMLIIYFNDATTRARLCQDIAMLEGNGARIGFGKLCQLGVKKNTPTLEPLSLVGERVYVSIDHREWEGEKQASVNIKAKKPFRFGYSTEAPTDREVLTMAVPEGQEIADSEVPF